EGVVHHPVGVGVLCGEPGEDGVVGGDSVHRAVGEQLHAFGVVAGFPELRADAQAAVFFAVDDVVGGTRPGSRAEHLAFEVFRTLDVRVVGGDDDVLLGDVVGAGEVDDVLAFVGDGVGGDDQVDGGLLEERLPVGGGGFRPLDLVRRVAEFAGDVGGDVHVEADRLVAFEEAEAGLVVFDPDGDGVTVAAVPSVASAADFGGTAGGESQGECGRPGQGGAGTADAHSSQPCPLSW